MEQQLNLLFDVRKCIATSHKSWRKDYEEVEMVRLGVKRIGTSEQK
jgi:hypothetical protein